MSLTTEDLTKIRTVVREEVDSVVSVKLQPIEDKIDKLDSEVQGLSNDVKAIYSSLSKAGIAVVTE